MKNLPLQNRILLFNKYPNYFVVHGSAPLSWKIQLIIIWRDETNKKMTKWQQINPVHVNLTYNIVRQEFLFWFWTKCNEGLKVHIKLIYSMIFNTAIYQTFKKYEVSFQVHSLMDGGLWAFQSRADQCTTLCELVVYIFYFWLMINFNLVSLTLVWLSPD